MRCCVLACVPLQDGLIIAYGRTTLSTVRLTALWLAHLYTSQELGSLLAYAGFPAVSRNE